MIKNIEAQILYIILRVRDLGFSPSIQARFIDLAERSLREEDFSDPEYRRAFVEICNLHKAGKPITTPILAHSIPKIDLLEAVVTRIPEVWLSDDPAEELKKELEANISIVQEEALNRKMWAVVKKTEEIQSKGGDHRHEYAAILEEAKSVLNSTIAKEGGPRPIIDLLNCYAENLESDDSVKIPTGITSLDAITRGGFSPGNLVILAARPSVGKTALMLDIAVTMAKDRHKVTVFSLEMTANEIVERILLSTGMITPGELIKDNLGTATFEAVIHSVESLPILIDEESFKLADITAAIERLSESQQTDVAFVDYLGLIGDDSTNDRHLLSQRLGEITKALKRTAKKTKIPIVLLCQLNRDSAKESRQPQLHDLRDSGAIEQDADIVLMLEQESKGESDERLLNLWVRKNRQGKKDACIVMRPNSTYSHFEEMNCYINN